MSIISFMLIMHGRYGCPLAVIIWLDEERKKQCGWLHQETPCVVCSREMWCVVCCGRMVCGMDS